jgi:predicted ATPase
MSTPRRASNVGFGITYVLPILTVLLKAKKGDVIIVENPEAHLHPKAQRMLGELILKAADVGAQIILETHSDHILNGIRLGVKNGIIGDANDVKNFFFTRENVGIAYHVNVYAPQIDQEGNLDIWPNGFFDEWDKALMELF